MNIIIARQKLSPLLFT